MNVIQDKLLLAVLLGVLACVTSTSIGAAGNIEWPAYGGAPGGGHYTPAKEITPANVKDLKQAWTHQSGDFVGGVQSLLLHTV